MPTKTDGVMEDDNDGGVWLDVSREEPLLAAPPLPVLLPGWRTGEGDVLNEM